MFVVMRPDTEEFLASFDPDWQPARESDRVAGMSGLATWPEDPRRAMKFADSGAAFDGWMTQSVSVPLRADGQPNRPLTAHTVTVVADPSPGA